MNDDRTYKIVVELPRDVGKQQVVAGDNSQKSVAPSVQTETASGAETALKGLVSFATVRALSNQIVSYEISQVNLRTGASEFEQQLQFGQSIVNKGFNIGIATVAGAAAGGPVGAVVGLVSSTMYSLIGLAQRQNTLQTKENFENIAIEMQNVRAGVSGRRGNKQ